MATTTNFGWETPDDTDLVKDGAAAMRTLGNSIDTSLVNLKGGTTGQVLSKASNTDMDFSWVTSDDANAIQNTIVDAKGDIITATGADTPARLAVGSNGFTLVADSSTSTGLAYAGTTNGNPTLNSAFQIWQRGTSVSVTANTPTYTADRWMLQPSGANLASTVSRQKTNDTTNLPSIEYCARVQRNSGQTGTAPIYFAQSFETTNSIPFVGRTVTLSFYARAGANFSSASNNLQFVVDSATGTDQNVINGTWTGGATPVTSSATLTTTWQRFSASGTISASATQIAVRFTHTPSGTAGANDWYEVTGVQIDLGSTVLPFRTATGTIQGELAACQRYYYRHASGLDTAIMSGGAYDSTVVGGVVKFATSMRTAPTLTVPNTAGYFKFYRNGGNVSAATLSLQEATTNSATIFGTFGASTAGHSGWVTCANASSYIDFGAEL